MDNYQERVFLSSELRPLLSLAKTTTLTDCSIIRDNFTKIGYGKWALNKGVSLDLLCETGRAARLKREQIRGKLNNSK